MNEHELQDALKDLLEEIATMGPEDRDDLGLLEPLEQIDRVGTYDQVGLLSGNAGVLLRTTDGSEYQISIVKSR